MDHINGPWIMEPSKSDEEAPKDPGALKTLTSITDNEINVHRNIYVGIHAPSKDANQHHYHHSRGARSHRHRGRTPKTSTTSQNESRPITPPAQRVQFILGDHEADGNHITHPLFSEMEELFCDEDGEMEWKETARWVKFEEDVEEGGNRWSKPHVATLSLHSLFELRSMLLNGTICLDMSAYTLEDICDLALETMANGNQLPYDKKNLVKDAILKKHRHQYESNKKSSDANASTSNMSRLPIIRSLAEIGRNHSSSKTNASQDELGSSATKATLNCQEVEGSSMTNLKNQHFMKKIPKDAEASNILVGELSELEKPLSAFIRLSEAVLLGDLTEVPVPTRFLFILLGPPGEDKVHVQRYHEIGRAVATIMSDEIFHDVAYKAKNREHLLAGIDEFLDAVTVLPPGEWDPSIRIEPPASVPSQSNRKNPNQKKEIVDEEEEEARLREEGGLVRTGRLFGGLINDFKRKKPFYWSDFKDGFAVQCIASYLFIYFSCLTPIITFGGLLGDATENRIAAIESLMSGFLVGVGYGLFSGQPLTIMGSTGPILVFETIVYDFCKSNGWEYLPFRLCIGIWIGIALLILVATDASAFVCYITRFTEENFATLIALIFVKKAFEKVLHISDTYPIHESECLCIPKNETELEMFGQATEFKVFNATKPHKYPCEFDADDFTVVGWQTPGCHYHPNAFLMSVLLFLGTFLLSYHLKKFRTQNFFPANVRGFISDFAVVIAISTMTLTDLLVNVDTPKLSVPGELRPTWSGRGWLIHPLGTNPWWSTLAAIIPALLGTILIFMDQQITAVIVNRKEHKLEKGCGYHLDLLIVLIMIVICSVFGLPWFVAATVLSINHVKSLTRESECSAPGEKPQFLGIREQRLTHVAIFVTIGLSTLMTPMLSHIPMPVLYGVFLYMGVASLNGLQFFDRILLFFMPKKYQPDYPYLRKVPIARVHLFTIVQLACLVMLWVVKDIKQTSIFFPIMLVVMMGVRKLLEFFFTKTELKILDDTLPEFKRKEKLDDEEALEKEEMDDSDINKGGLRYTKSGIEVPMANGNIMKIPCTNDSDINISEEMNRSGVWQSLEGNSQDEFQKPQNSEKRCQRMTTLKETEDEDDSGITIKVCKKRKSKNSTSEEATAEEIGSLMRANDTIV